MNLIVVHRQHLVKLAVFDGGRIVASAAWSGCIRRCSASCWRAQADAKAVVARRAAKRTSDRTVRPYADTAGIHLADPVRLPTPTIRPRRWAATAGRRRGRHGALPGRNVLIVDFGTAVTIDLVSATTRSAAGVHFAGMKTRFRALHDYTASCRCAVDRKRGVAGANHRRGHPPGGDELADLRN